MTPFRIRQRVLDEARQFFEERGADGVEGTALIVQRGQEIADRLVVPTQRAARVDGCWVEVPLEGKLEPPSRLSCVISTTS